MGLTGRVHLEWISSAEAQKFVQVIHDFTETVRSLGPNPLAAYLDAAHAVNSLAATALEKSSVTGG